MLTGKYYFNPEAALVPYVGFGLGTICTERKLDFGLYESITDAWQFSLKPEVGLVYKVSNMLGLKVSGEYDQAFDTSELAGQSCFFLNVGVVSYIGY